MRTVDLESLKSKLSEYVRLAAGGETVLITDRDRVVAQLTPPAERQSPLLADTLLAEAVHKGWLSPAIGPSSSPPPRQPVAPLAVILGELDADREER
jgi:antitoxin (DNA-binding transcriptional repressor) of toxin-antitoxin stability system